MYVNIHKIHVRSGPNAVSALQWMSLFQGCPQGVSCTQANMCTQACRANALLLKKAGLRFNRKGFDPVIACTHSVTDIMSVSTNAWER